MSSFEELGVADFIRRAIEEMGFAEPMPVQEAVIPLLLGGDGDVVGLAQTGTGKTAAYGLPILQNLDVDSALTQALVLSPTRELCLQIASDLRSYAKYMPGVRVLSVYGGADIGPQIRSLSQGVQIVVATPGRLIDLMERGAAKLDCVGCVVLDESDEMLSMGFAESIDAILEGVPENHRTLLFSATMSKEIERVSKKYLKGAKEIVIGSRNEGAETVDHVYFLVHAKDKYLALKRIVDFYPDIYAIIFCRTRMETQEVADKLIQDGYNADALHGDLSQQQRDLTMQRFRQHRIEFLVATDVAARGLDVDDLTHVINYGMPDDIESYTHRSGRTGRAGKKGTSICIVHTRERRRIGEIEKTIGKRFVKGSLPSGKDICEKQLLKVVDDIERTVVDEEEIEGFMPQVSQKLACLDKEDIIKRVVSREFGRFLQYYANAPEIDEPSETGARSGRRNGKDGTKTEPGYARLFIGLGKVDGYYAKEIMLLINNKMDGRVDIGRIDLKKNFSFFEVPEGDAERVVDALSGVFVKGRRISVERANERDGEPQEKKGKKRVEKPEEKIKGRKKREVNGPRMESDGKEEHFYDAFAKKKNAGVKPSRQERGYTQPRGPKYTKNDWKKFFRSDEQTDLVGDEPDFSEEGWARRYPKK